MRRTLACVLAVSIVSLHAPAFAAGDDPLKDAAAAEKAGDWGSAAAAYERANAAKPAAQTQLKQAGALDRAGKPVEAVKVVDAILKDPKTAKDVAAQAKKRRTDFEAHVGHVVIEAKSADATARVDAADVAVGDVLALDPGDHDVEVRAPGHETSSKTVKLGVGESRTLTFKLKRLGDADAAAGSVVDAASGASSRSIGWVSLGVGVLGVGVGVVAGLKAKQQHDELKTGCPNDVCPVEYQTILDKGKQNANISTAGFAVGGVALVVGAVLLATSSDGASASAAVKPAVQPYIGTSEAGLAGRF